MTRILACLFVVCVSISHSPAQERSSYFTFSSGLTLTGFSEGLQKYSAPGWSVGVGLAHDLNKYVRFLTEVSYRRFGVDYERVYASYPNARVWGWPIRAEASQEFEGRIGFRIGFTANAVRPYMTIGGGAMLVREGAISFLEPMWDGVRGRERGVVGFVFLGLGVEFPVAGFLSSSIGAEISTDFYVEDITVPIVSRWFFRL